MIHYTLALWLVVHAFTTVPCVNSPEWGFFGHRKINRMAVFTLPHEMLPLYKTHIDYLEEHSVDPDKRRYATPYEAIRHYIDLDQWAGPLPKEWAETLAHHTQWMVISDQGDTTYLDLHPHNKDSFSLPSIHQSIAVKAYHRLFKRHILPQYHEDRWHCSVDTVNHYLGLSLAGNACVWLDTFSPHGILPYYLPQALDKLTRAFQAGHTDRILQLSAEIGHYIGDAHVPLHTTKNYNGQLTGQNGIHAFWESRLPELFADSEYDFWAGKAEYIDDPIAYFWDIVMQSHQLLPIVLEGEKWLSENYPKDNQYCYDERLGLTVRIQCREYAKAYHDKMQGMVEDRMRSAIRAIGSAWFTAWVNAGQPKLPFKEKPAAVADETELLQRQNPTIKVRPHDMP